MQIVADANELLSQIRDGQWNLVIANIALTGTDSAAFLTLRELSAVRADEGGRLRTLYIVPEMSGSHFIKLWNRNSCTSSRGLSTFTIFWRK